MSKKRFRLITSVIVIAAFLSTSEAAGGLESARPTAARDAFDIETLTLPAGLGEVSSVFKGTNGKTILHIQDAHCNYNAQHSIADIVSNFSGLYNARLVFLEGGRGTYDFSAFDNIKDPLIREKVSDYFVKEGIVTGAEFLAINNPGSLELYGIEDEGLYFKNLKVYRDSLAFKKEADSYLKTLSRAMDNLKLKTYSPRLKELDEKTIAHREYKISFKAYAAYLKEKAEANNIPIAPYKNLSSLFATIRIEAAINFKEAERERGTLINKLESVLPKGDLKELARCGAEYKAGEIPSEAFYGYLFKKAKIANADFRGMPNLVKYSQYLKTYESIDKSALLKEMEDVEALVADRLAGTIDQRKIRRLDKDLTILKAIFNTSLIKEDFDYYSAHKDDFDVKNFTGFFIRKGPVYGLKFTPDEKLNSLDTYRNEMEKFYEYSFKRDDAFLKNIEAKLASDKKNVAILVTGGFHSANLFKLFKDKGYSYAKIMPKFKADQDDNPYFNLLAGGMTPTDEFLKTAVSYTPPAPAAAAPAKSMLAIETPFSQMLVPTLVKNIIGLEIDMLPRLMANKDFTIQTAAGFIVISRNPIENEKALESFSVTSHGITFNAAFVSGPLENHAVDAVLLDNESMNWSRAAGITEGAPGQGPQVAGDKKVAAVFKYYQVVRGITGVIAMAGGKDYAGEVLIKAGQGEVIEGVPGAPYRIVLKTYTENDRTYIEVPQPEGDITKWRSDMIEFNKTVLKALPGRLDLTKQYKIYVEHPENTKASAESAKIGLQRILKDKYQITNVEVIPFTPNQRDTIAAKVEKAASDIGKERVIIFAMKEKGTLDTPWDTRVKANSLYTLYTEIKAGVGYVPVMTCGAIALKIFDYENIRKQITQKKEVTPSDIRDQNTAVELIARGIGLLCGASEADVIETISTFDKNGLRRLLQSGSLHVVIRPVNINEIGKLNEMAKLVHEAV
ncbi:MAG: hypothetical protein V1927_03410 [Candidatus Omnitrophota bacterium]